MAETPVIVRGYVVVVSSGTLHRDCCLPKSDPNRTKLKEYIELYGFFSADEGQSQELSAEMSARRIIDPSFCF